MIEQHSVLFFEKKALIPALQQLHNLTLTIDSNLVQVPFGTPSGSTQRTFRAVLLMPVNKYKHNLIEVGQKKYRNPIFIAREWHGCLDSGEYESFATLTCHLKVSRGRFVRILSLEILTSKDSSYNKVLGLGGADDLIFYNKLAEIHQHGLPDLRWMLANAFL